MRFILASQSPARLTTLRNAGIEPVVIVSHVDEDAILDALALPDGSRTPEPTVLALARAKCEAVTSLIANEPGWLAGEPAIVAGCDSMLEIGGVVLGKPQSAEAARERWLDMRGRSAVLHTGHWLARLEADGSTVGYAGRTSSAVVHFAQVSEAEIDAYVATGEPLEVAGAFTIDGLGGAFVESIEGDPHGIVGLSLPLARNLARELGVLWNEFWNR